MNKFNPWCATIVLLLAAVTSARAADPTSQTFHDGHGNFNGQVITQPDGERKIFDCHGDLVGWTTSNGTYNKHGDRVGSVFDLSQQITDCRGKPVGR